jgi:hypothetical protein
MYLDKNKRFLQKSDWLSAQNEELRCRWCSNLETLVVKENGNERVQRTKNEITACTRAILTSREENISSQRRFLS